MKTVISSVAFQGPDGAVAANGRLLLSLSQNAMIIAGGGQVYSNIPVVIDLDANGKIPVSPAVTIWANDELTPSGTTYLANLQDKFGSRLDTLGVWSITGASPIDLSQMVPIASSTISAPGVVFTSPSGNQVINQPAGTNLSVNRFENVRYADQFANIQAAITDAGTSGAVIIPPNYIGTDSYSNANGIPILDLRIINNAIGIWSVLQPSFPISNFPLGNDLALHAAGPADVHLRIRDLQVTSSTSTVAATPVTVTVASPTLYGVAQVGNATALFSTSAGIILEPGTANEETVATFTIAGASTLTFTPTLNHTQPFKIRQQGVVFFDSPCGLKVSADPTGQYNFFTIFDGNGNAAWKLPIQNGAFPLNALQQSAIITGGNGANSDIVWRNNKAASLFKLLNSGNTASIFQVDDSANWRGASSIGINGATSGIVILNTPAIAGGNFATLPANTGTIAELNLAQAWTATQTFTGPVINGTPTGTGIATATLKTGSGAGNYTTASTTFVRVDSTNLAYTVTIPTGWKLIIHASGSVSQATATAGTNIALADGSADNTGILIVVQTSPAISGSNQFESFALDWIVNGDGASHTINLQFLTGNAADSSVMVNSSSTVKPVMTFLLTPSN